MTYNKLREYAEYLTGVDTVDPDKLSVDLDAARNLDLQG